MMTMVIAVTVQQPKRVELLYLSVINLSAGTESSTIGASSGASSGPPPVTSYDIIIPKWLLEYVYIENMLGMKLRHLLCKYIITLHIF